MGQRKGLGIGVRPFQCAPLLQDVDEPLALLAAPALSQQRPCLCCLAPSSKSSQTLASSHFCSLVMTPVCHEQQLLGRPLRVAVVGTVLAPGGWLVLVRKLRLWWGR